MNNIPEVRLAIIGVSRDCFPIVLSDTRRKAVVDALGKKSIDIIDVPFSVENEIEAMEAVHYAEEKGANALAVFLSNFVPETP